jgi:hypothetical protein
VLASVDCKSKMVTNARQTFNVEQNGENHLTKSKRYMNNQWMVPCKIIYILHRSKYHDGRYFNLKLKLELSIIERQMMSQNISRLVETFTAGVSSIKY